MTAFTLRIALRLRNVPLFLYLLPRSRLVESCFQSVGLFPPGWNGGFHSWKFRVSLSVVLVAGRFSPIQEHWVPGYLVLGSCPIELLPPSCSGCAASAAAPVHHTLRQPCFPRKTSASWVLTVSSAPGSERRSLLGRYPCSGSIFGLISFYPSG